MRFFSHCTFTSDIKMSSSLRPCSYWVIKCQRAFVYCAAFSVCYWDLILERASCAAFFEDSVLSMLWFSFWSLWIKFYRIRKLTSLPDQAGSGCQGLLRFCQWDCILRQRGHTSSQKVWYSCLDSVSEDRLLFHLKRERVTLNNASASCSWHRRVSLGATHRSHFLFFRKI